MVATVQTVALSDGIVIEPPFQVMTNEAAHVAGTALRHHVTSNCAVVVG